MIKAIVFDLGKVLVDFDYAIAVRNLAPRCKLSLLELSRLVSPAPLFFDYETGLVSSEQFFQEICKLTGYVGTIDEFGESFGNIFTPIEPMIRMQADLRRRGLPTYIFSNTNDMSIRYIRRHLPFFKNFDGYVLSYEHRVMKPDARLYEVVERLSGRRGPELLYLDDRPENVAAGATRGWQGILHESPPNSRAIIEKLGLLS